MSTKEIKHVATERTAITLDQAIALLPDGPTIHTFYNPMPGMTVGADWDRSDVLRALVKARDIQVTGERAQEMGHGLAVRHNGDWVFIQAARYTLPSHRHEG